MTTDIDQRAQALGDRLERSQHWVSPDYRVRESTAAHVLGCTARTLQRWREQGSAPPFVVIGRALSYRLTDLLHWIDARRYSV